MSTVDAGVICPRDGEQLVEIERDGVLVDECPACHGIWLDRGELEKLVERTGEDDEPETGRAKRRRGGFLENLLDFGGD